MAGSRTLTPQEVVERLNRSLEQELSILEDTLPASPSSTWGASVPQNRGPKSVPRRQKLVGNGTLVPTGAERCPASGDAIETDTAGPRRMRANASLLGKLEASRLHALESLSSVLFDDGRSTAQPTTKRVENGAAGERFGSHQRRPLEGSKERRPRANQRSLQARLRQRAAKLVQEERGSLLRELHAELDSERKFFEATKPAISEEAHRAARKEQASSLQKQEHELRAVLARRELKDLKDAARERLTVEYAQKKEKVLARLRRSLGRGTGHSVNGLRGELWDEAHVQRTRALHEGEAAFEHSCRLLRQQCDRNTQAKVDAMGKEAMMEEESALAILREVEANATLEELSRVTRDLERDETEAEAELKRQLHREAARSVTIAVDACTSNHKRAQQETTTKAAEALRQALEAVGDDEVARTKAVLGREARILDERRYSLIAAVEEGLSACSLRKLAEVESSRSPLSPLPSSPRSTTRTRNSKRDSRDDEDEAVERGGVWAEDDDDDDDDDNDDDDDDAVPSFTGMRKNKGDDFHGHAVRSSTARHTEWDSSAARRAMSVVRHVEGVAAAAEREYAKRARGLVRSRAAAALRERHDDKSTGNNAVNVVVGPQAYPIIREKGEGLEGGDGGAAVCGGCAVIFEANEKLLQEARARGFFVG